MGSIATGKDADIVLWDDHPLSVYARPEQTYVDGTKYFDLEEDATKRNLMRGEVHACTGDESGRERRRPHRPNACTFTTTVTP